MAHEFSNHHQISVATIPSSTQPTWWEINLHNNASSSWTSSTNPMWNVQANPSSNSSCEEDVLSMSTTITRALNRSGVSNHEPVSSDNMLSCDDRSNGHASNSQLWSQILIGIGSNNGVLNESQNAGENLLDALSSKNLSSSTIFEPECDYLKKMDMNWEYTDSSSSLTNFESNKQLSSYGTEINMVDNDHQRMNKFCNLVSDWSIAPPNPEINNQFDPISRNISLKSSINHEYSNPPTFGDDSCFAQGLIKVENDRGDSDLPNRATFGQSLLGLNNSVVGDNSELGYFGVTNSLSCVSARHFTDALSYGSRLSKPLIDVQAPKLRLKSLSLSDSKKQGLQNSSSIIGKAQRSTIEGKKKRSEDASNPTPAKKSKQDSPTASSTKVQAPKVKITDKITALQQIVSPFGKTDTASVLMEAIQYIKFLQEQVKLLSNPYHVKSSNTLKDPWGSLGRNDYKAENGRAVDLRGKGLCLVPISCTPQVCYENTGSDFWTPTYRGCLYR